MRRHLHPLALHHGMHGRALVESGHALPLLGDSVACSLFELIEGDRRQTLHARQAADLPELGALQAPREWAGQTQIIGVLNVTPDSFSEGGPAPTAEAAIARGLQLAADGATIIDVGGESTRPGALPVPAEVEIARVAPVLHGLVEAGLTVSIDTRKAEVMRVALDLGVELVNDISGLTHDPASLETVAASEASIILMHIQGEPETMNVAPRYERCALEVLDWLSERIEACARAGIARRRLVLDPGLCFGKHEPHNLDLMRHLALFHELGCPLVLGASRKGWTRAISRGWPARERLPASLVAAQWALDRGIQGLRVHDVAATRQMVTAWQKLAE